MTAYELFLLATLVIWPLVIGALLFAMSAIERRIERVEAETPEEAGLEPVEGSAREKEVRIIFGGRVVGENPEGPERRRPEPRRAAPER